jgi:3-methyladenine DNA glycosylase AlkC
MVVHHHLGDVAHLVHPELVGGVVQAWSAVQQHERWPLHHLAVDRHQAEPVDVRLQSDAAPDVDAHDLVRPSRHTSDEPPPPR